MFSEHKILLPRGVSHTLLSLLPEDEIAALQNKVPTGQTPIWMPWQEFAEDFLDEGRSGDTLMAIRTILRRLIRDHGVLSLEQCNETRFLTLLLKQMKKAAGFKNSSFNKYKVSINSYFRWLETMDYIKENKIAKIRKRKEDAVEVYALEEDQIEQIFNHIYMLDQIPFVKWRNLLFFDLLRATGVRKNELLNLKVTDICLRRREGFWAMKIHRSKQKGDIDYLPLPIWVGNSYTRYLEIRNKTRSNEEYLFCSQSKKDVGLTDKGVSYFIKAVEKILGYRLNPHAFRSYVATRLALEGHDEQHIANYLGHKRTSMTKRYIKKSALLHMNAASTMASQINADTLMVKNFVPGTIH